MRRVSPNGRTFHDYNHNIDYRRPSPDQRGVFDSVDPAYAPGTGTPEVGGFTNREAVFMLRLLRGLNIVGADVVEVSPPFDPSGYTAYNAANLMWELLCIMSEAVSKRRG